ncbi:MAG: sugar phosphate isomerase/epimerase family protein [Alphaproteobacteria bacterium]
MSDGLALSELSINHYLCAQGYPLGDFIELVASTGAGAVGLTVRALDEISLPGLKRRLRDAGLRVSSLNSAGYFLYPDSARAQAQRDLGERLIEASAALEAETLVVITGGLSHGPWTLEEARARVAEGIAELAERARPAGVRLGLEPIHPMDVLDKGVVNTIAEALAIAEGRDNVGLTIDLFHSWWDRDLWAVLQRARDKVFLYQLCNVVARDAGAKPDRALFDEGMLDVGDIVQRIRDHGYAGFLEFELFPQHLRGRSTEDVVRAAAAQYRALAGPSAAG